jgi:hypothetical protein
MLPQALGLFFTLHAFHFSPLPRPVLPSPPPLASIDHMLRTPGVHAFVHDDYLHTAIDALRRRGRAIACLDGCEYLLRYDDGDPLRWILMHLGFPTWMCHRAAALPPHATLIIEHAELIDNVVPCAAAFANIQHLCVFFVFSSSDALTRALADTILRMAADRIDTPRI